MAHESMTGETQPKANTALDPVCGMYVDPRTASGAAEYQGQKYFFCSPHCVERFNAEPEKYLAGNSPQAPELVQLGGAVKTSQPSSSQPSLLQRAVPAGGEQGSIAYVCPMDPEVHGSTPGPCPKCGMALERYAAESVQYTCPMHPEIVRDRPGNCPICGMALEPRIAAAVHEEDDSELRSMTRRFWVGVGFSVPLLLISMWGMTPAGPLHDLHLHPGWMQWLQLLLATPVVLWGGCPFFHLAWPSLVNRHLNMFTLIALGNGATYFFSVVATIAPRLFPESFLGHGGRTEVYFEVSASIVTLVLLGQVLELRARRNTSSAIRALLDLSPKTARRIRPDGADDEIPLDQVQARDRLRVRPGDRVPVDGVVEEGTSAVDESMLTSHSIPVEKQQGANGLGAH